jgi:hypothetical protein
MGTLNRPLNAKLQPVAFSTVDSALIYIMVVKVRNTVSPLPPQIETALYTISNGRQSAYKGKRWGAV